MLRGNINNTVVSKRSIRIGFQLDFCSFSSFDFLINPFCYRSAVTPNSEQAPSAFGEEETEQSSEDPPTVVVYVVNPFSSNSREESFPSYLGLLRCIAEIIPDISENGKKNIIFQVHQLPCLSVFPSIYLSTCQHGCLLVYLSPCPSVCLHCYWSCSCWGVEPRTTYNKSSERRCGEIEPVIFTAALTSQLFCLPDHQFPLFYCLCWTCWEEGLFTLWSCRGRYKYYF